MGKFDDILLTVDFDRTLSAGDSTVPQRNLDAIRYFMEEGGAFTVNTGRSLAMFSAYLDLVPVNAPLLLCNGAAAYDLQADRFLFSYPIEGDRVTMLRQVEQLLPDFVLEEQTQHVHLLFREDKMWEAYCRRNGCPYGYAKMEKLTEPFLKFTLYSGFRTDTVEDLYLCDEAEEQRMNAAARLLEQTFAGRVQVIRAAPRLLDVQATGLSKGIAARRLAKELGRKTLVCVGDGMNDRPMLDEADYAFCPAGSIIDGLYETVCDCDSGAVADVIEKKLPEILG